MHHIGIDIGSASACVALLNTQGELIEKKYLLLKGGLKENKQLLKRELSKLLTGDDIYKIAVSGSGAKMLSLPSVNEVSALAAGARHVAPNAASVIEIGGGSAKYIADLQKSQIQFALNDNCSAGTGSFFAAQMQRLGLPLESYSEMVAKAKSIAPIAGRCSVFAKTDIIHSQQAGTSIEDILLGLCYAVVRNYKASVAGKLPLQKPVLLTGGTALNKGVVDAIKDIFKLNSDELIVLKGLDILNNTKLGNDNRNGYSKIYAGVKTYLAQNGLLTADEQKNKLFVEGVACFLYSKTGFPKDNGIWIFGMPFALHDNAQLFKEICATAIMLQSEVEEAYLSKRQQVTVIYDTDEQAVSDEPIAENMHNLSAAEEKPVQTAPEYTLTPYYQRYLDAQQKYPDSVIAIRLGDFYEFMDDNALKVSQLLDITLTGRSVGLPERVPMCGFPYHVADIYMKCTTEYSAWKSRTG